MSDPLYDIDLTTPVEVSPLMESRPFERDQVTTVRRRTYRVLNTHFEREPLDTPLDEFPDHYLVNETDPQHIEQGVVEFEREWSMIPQSRTEYETYVHRVPGTGTGSTTYTLLNIASASTFGGVLTLTTSTAHPYSQGESITIQYTVFEASLGAYVPRSVVRVISSVPDTTHLVVPLINDPGGTIAYSNIFQSDAGRDPYDRTVLSTVHYDYFLPGVSPGIQSPADIPVFEPIRIVGADNNETDRYSDTTEPSVDDYRAQVAAGSMIVAETSLIRAWMGNIHERSTRYLKAI